MLNGAVQAVNNGVLHHAEARVDAAAVGPLPPAHEFVYGYVLRSVVFLVAPGMAEDVEHDLDFGQCLKQG